MAAYANARLRQQLRPIHLDGAYRVTRARHHATPLAAVPTPSRFSDPNGSYPVLYGASTVACAFLESRVRNILDRRARRAIPRSSVDDAIVVAFRSTSSLLLIDLRGDGPIRLGAPTAVTHDSRHTAGQALSAAIYSGVDEADGLVYASRFTGDLCLAVFDRALPKLATTAITRLVEHDDFLSSIEHFDITLTTP